MKKLINFLICCLFCLAFIPNSAFAENYPDSRPHQGYVPRHPEGPRPSDEHVVTEEEIAARATIATAATLASVMMQAPIPTDDNYSFGMDLRGFGAAATDLKLGGGLGVDLWVRPMRWFSVELYVDFVFNKNKSLSAANEAAFDSTLRLPIYLGARIHAFDYAAYDIYGAIAAGVNIQYLSNDKKGVGGGLQAGLGASYTISGFRIGVDVRYTLESLHSKFNRNLIHGCIFSLNIGFAR